MNWERVILHVDMDAFFASIEQRDFVELRGVPVLVGHDGVRGVVAAASYEARVFGCRSAMPMVTAKRLCPHARVVAVRGGVYREVSREVFGIFERYTPVVEPVSIDEAYLDVTGVERLHGDGEAIARKIKEAVRREVGLTCSVGVAGNKFLAKLASDIRKPDGLVVMGEEEAERMLPGMEVGRIHGIGPKTAEMLAGVGVKRVGDLRAMGKEWVEAKLGSSGEFYWGLAWGKDSREVHTDEAAKSIGHEETFETDLADAGAVKDVLLGQVEAVGERLRRHGLKARRVHLKIRFGDFVTIGRSRTLARGTDVTAVLWETARAVFEEWEKEGFLPVRLIGMSAGELGEGEGQMVLFGDEKEAAGRKVDEAVDAINLKFGKGKVKRGGS